MGKTNELHPIKLQEDKFCFKKAVYPKENKEYMGKGPLGKRYSMFFFEAREERPGSKLISEEMKEEVKGKKNLEY